MPVATCLTGGRACRDHPACGHRQATLLWLQGSPPTRSLSVSRSRAASRTGFARRLRGGLRPSLTRHPIEKRSRQYRGGGEGCGAGEPRLRRSHRTKRAKPSQPLVEPPEPPGEGVSRPTQSLPARTRSDSTPKVSPGGRACRDHLPRKTRPVARSRPELALPEEGSRQARPPVWGCISVEPPESLNQRHVETNTVARRSLSSAQDAGSHGGRACRDHSPRGQAGGTQQVTASRCAKRVSTSSTTECAVRTWRRVG
ncbi:hypothetical protein J2S40_000536 [Nocardioides luteus]|nr:hypothetical protein [Nocardioides luteus]